MSRWSDYKYEVLLLAEELAAERYFEMWHEIPPATRDALIAEATDKWISERLPQYGSMLREMDGCPSSGGG